MAFDWLRMHPAHEYTQASQSVLSAHGGARIRTITLCKTPIRSAINTALNWLSIGKWDALLQRHGLVKAFHLAILVELEAAAAPTKTVLIERNETVNVSTAYTIQSDTELFEVPLGADASANASATNITLSALVEDARIAVGDAAFFGYDAFTNNCQVFVRDVLSAQGLYTDAVKNFLFQDFSVIYDEMPSYAVILTKAATTAGVAISKLVNDDGFSSQTIALRVCILLALLVFVSDNGILRVLLWFTIWGLLAISVLHFAAQELLTHIARVFGLRGEDGDATATASATASKN
jgi:hypothetical protein